VTVLVIQVATLAGTIPYNEVSWLRHGIIQGGGIIKSSYGDFGYKQTWYTSLKETVRFPTVNLYDAREGVRGRV